MAVDEATSLASAKQQSGISALGTRHSQHQSTPSEAQISEAAATVGAAAAAAAATDVVAFAAAAAAHLCFEAHCATRVLSGL